MENTKVHPFSLDGEIESIKEYLKKIRLRN